MTLEASLTVLVFYRTGHRWDIKIIFLEKILKILAKKIIKKFAENLKLLFVKVSLQNDDKKV